MAIVLYRVDDRLIHGQVVVGWGARLGIDHIIVVADELVDSEWEQELYRAGLPESMESEFVNVNEAAERLPEWQRGAQRAILLTRDLSTMRRLAEAGALGAEEVNLGGLHDAPSRRRVLPYLFLSDDDREELERLARAGVRVIARDVPTARRVGLDELTDSRSR